MKNNIISNVLTNVLSSVLSNSVLHNLNLLHIFKNVVALLFIGLIFFFTISLFSKTNHKIVEGNWFESEASKRRRMQRQMEATLALIQRIRACETPTAANFRSCGAMYYFPDAHTAAGANAAEQIFRQKMNNSKKPDVALTTSLNNSLNRY